VVSQFVAQSQFLKKIERAQKFAPAVSWFPSQSLFENAMRSFFVDRLAVFLPNSVRNLGLAICWCSNDTIWLQYGIQ